MDLPIAEQYGLRLSRDYKVKSSCVQHTGDVNDVNKKHCWSVAKKEKAPPLLIIHRLFQITYVILSTFYLLPSGPVEALCVTSRRHFQHANLSELRASASMSISVSTQR